MFILIKYLIYYYSLIRILLLWPKLIWVYSSSISPYFFPIFFASFNFLFTEFRFWASSFNFMVIMFLPWLNFNPSTKLFDKLPEFSIILFASFSFISLIPLINSPLFRILIPDDSLYEKLLKLILTLMS